MNPLLKEVRAVLAAERDSACLLDRDGRITFCNAAWDRFAVENEGAPGALGRAVVSRRWMEFLVGDTVVRHYTAVLKQVLEGAALSFEAQCNTPNVGRILLCRFQPVQARRNGPVNAVAILYSVMRSVPIAELHKPHPPRDDLYVDADGLIVMCACCRRVRRRGQTEDHWDFVPSYVQQLRCNISHGFCATCFGLQRATLVSTR